MLSEPFGGGSGELVERGAMDTTVMPSTGIGSGDPMVLMEIIRAQTEIAKLGMDLGAVMVFVAERVRQLTHAGGAMVELAEGDEMVYRAVTGMAANQLGLRLKREGSLSGLCVAEGNPLQCDDSEIDPRVDREACRRVGLRSMVVSPLNYKGTTVGVLKIASPAANAFSQQHMQILTLMSELIAAAMFHAVKYVKNELYHQATHDGLTGLANRALFYDRLRQSVALARRKSGQVAVLKLDIDGMKSINHEHGHQAGDAAICEIARRISQGSRESDTVARLSGGEFGIVLSEVPGRDGAVALAGRLAKEIRLPFQFEGRLLPLDASIGMALFPDDGAEFESLIEAADKSMYAIKWTRKNAR